MGACIAGCHVISIDIVDARGKSAYMDMKVDFNFKINLSVMQRSIGSS